jgi:2-oxoacid:acceptor oxidoreductase delta subunit (pyruvate/2-ketoisovalerate family)
MGEFWNKQRPYSAWHEGGWSKRNKGKVSRTVRPVLDEKKCTKCSLCWIFCPDEAIERGDPYVIDYDFCKGCGICANECPRDAISMERED